MLASLYQEQERFVKYIEEYNNLNLFIELRFKSKNDIKHQLYCVLLISQR